VALYAESPAEGVLVAMHSSTYKRYKYPDVNWFMLDIRPLAISRTLADPDV